MKAFLFVILLSSNTAKAHSLKLTDFKKVVGKCLKSKNVKCLQKYIAKDLNFPEHTTFGCQTEKPKKITPYEFALCAMKSKIKCTEFQPKITPMTLYEVMMECFTNLQSVSSEDQIVTRSGYVCRLEDINHELFISSVAIQEHLSGFEENVNPDDHRVKK